VSSFWSYSNAVIFKIPASGTDFQNTGFLPVSAKLAVKYRPGRWNTGHLATLIPTHKNTVGPAPALRKQLQQKVQVCLC